MKTNMQLRKFTNLIDLLTFFNSEQVCREYLELSRWGDELGVIESADLNDALKILAPKTI